MKHKVTIRDLAKAAGVSVTTVSQILNGKGQRFSQATQQRVLELRDQMKTVQTCEDEVLNESVIPKA